MRTLTYSRFSIGFAALLLVPTLAMAQLSGSVPLKGQTLTTPILKQMLEDMGYEPEETTKDIFRITVERDRWKVPIRLYILKDSPIIWLDATLSQVENPELVPPQALVRLLKENEKIGPAHFALHSTDKFLHLYEAVENRDITQASLSKRIDKFDSTVRKTQEVWKADNFKSTGASIPPNEPMGEFVPRDQDRFAGTWRVTKIIANGMTSSAEELNDLNMTMSFNASGSVIVQRKGTPQETAKWVISSNSTPSTIDITTFEGKLEKGIYKFEGNTLTICYANPDEERPKEFAAPEGFSGGVLVLTKQR